MSDQESEPRDSTIQCAIPKFIISLFESTSKIPAIPYLRLLYNNAELKSQRGGMYVVSSLVKLASQIQLSKQLSESEFQSASIVLYSNKIDEGMIPELLHDADYLAASIINQHYPSYKYDYKKTKSYIDVILNIIKNKGRVHADSESLIELAEQSNEYSNESFNNRSRHCIVLPDQLTEPLDIAIRKNNIELVKIILSHKSHTKKQEQMAVLVCGIWEKLEILQYLILNKRIKVKKETIQSLQERHCESALETIGRIGLNERLGTSMPLKTDTAKQIQDKKI